MNDDSSLRNSQVMLTVGIVICSVLAVISFVSLPHVRLPKLLSLGGQASEVKKANQQLSESYSEFYPDTKFTNTVPARTVALTVEDRQKTPTTSDSTGSRSNSRRSVFQLNGVAEVHGPGNKGETRLNGLKDKTKADADSQLDFGSDSQTHVVADGRQPLQIDSAKQTYVPQALDLTPHITVPVTVNIDNGEILSELMRIQEEVLVTRNKLAELHVFSEYSKERTKTGSDSTIDLVQTGPTDLKITPKQAPAVSSETSDSDSSPAKSVSNKPASVPTEPELTKDDFGFDDFEDIEPSPVAASPPEEQSESATPPPAASESSDDLDVRFEDFAQPNSGPADQEMDEELPNFEAPTQSSSKPSVPRVNSYAEWIQSVEESTAPETNSEVMQVVFTSLAAQEEPPIIPLFDETTENFSNVPKEIAPLPPTPEQNPASPTFVFPPVPVGASDDLRESDPFQVFPISAAEDSEPTEPEQQSSNVTNPEAKTHHAPALKQTVVTATSVQRSDGSSSSRTMAVNPSSAKQGLANQKTLNQRPATRQPSKTVSTHNALVAAQRRSAAATGKPVDSHKRQSRTATVSVLSKMKSGFSNAVSRVSKPDFDTPMWVDRLADWNDDRFGKKNDSVAQESGSQQQMLAGDSSTAASTRSRASNRVHRVVDSRNTAERHNAATNNGTGTGSGDRPRANVTTVPRLTSPVQQRQQSQIALIPVPRASSPRHVMSGGRPATAGPAVPVVPDSVAAVMLPQDLLREPQSALLTVPVAASEAAVSTSEGPNSEEPSTPVPAIPVVQTLETAATFQPDTLQQPQSALHTIPVVSAEKPAANNEGPVTPVPAVPVGPTSVAAVSFQQTTPQQSQPLEIPQVHAPAVTPQKVSNSNAWPSTPIPAIPVSPAPVAHAAFQQNRTQIAAKPVQQTSYNTSPVPRPLNPERSVVMSTPVPRKPVARVPQNVVAETWPTRPTTRSHIYQPVPDPEFAAYPQQSTISSAQYADSQRVYGKMTTVPPRMVTPTPTQNGEPTAYIGTLDAFNYRMTMVVRPPSFSNFGIKPVSQWFSDSSSYEPVEQPLILHRVSSSMHYATQPRTVR